MANATRAIPIDCVFDKTGLIVASGLIFSAIFSFAAFILAYLGYMGLIPEHDYGYSIVAFGAALAIAGASVLIRQNCIESQSHETVLSDWKFEAATRVMTIGAATGFILGILALLGVIAGILEPLSLIVYAISTLSGIGVSSYLNRLDEVRSSPELVSLFFMKVKKDSGIWSSKQMSPLLARFTAKTMPVLMFFQAIAALVTLAIGIQVLLGSIVLMGANAVTLSLLCMILLGATGFLNYGALSIRMLTMASDLPSIPSS